jgi:uncharacterized protein YndB with AHSA1/START domain
VHLERVLAAPPARVFAMNIEPELLQHWWGPEGFSAPSVEVDARVGGRYRIVMQPPDGDAFAVSGEFRVVEAGSRLAYTFRWEPPDRDDRETVVVVSFHGRGESTLCAVDHTGFATEARRALHEHGWSESLDRLEELCAGQDRSTPE